jgi:hypothetical protein
VDRSIPKIIPQFRMPSINSTTIAGLWWLPSVLAVAQPSERAGHGRIVDPTAKAPFLTPLNLLFHLSAIGTTQRCRRARWSPPPAEGDVNRGLP